MNTVNKVVFPDINFFSSPPFLSKGELEDKILPFLPKETPPQNETKKTLAALPLPLLKRAPFCQHPQNNLALLTLVRKIMSLFL